MIWLLVAIAVLIAAPFVYERFRKPMDQDARRTAPGQFAELPMGATHYHWQGPQTGPVVVCIHGLTTPSFVYQGIVCAFVALGFRVLVYDHYGRGYSDRPKGAQDSAFFLRHLNDLLEHQKAGADLIVFGYSMGGAIATCFAAAHPERVKRLILLAPAGTASIQSRLARFIMKTPILGDALMLAIYPGMLRKGIEAERGLPVTVEGISALQEAELQYRGYFPAILSSLRGVLASPLEDEHRAIAVAQVPTIAIWGDEDDVIPTAAPAQLKALNPNAKQATIQGAGHGLAYTHTDQIMALLEL